MEFETDSGEAETFVKLLLYGKVYEARVQGKNRKGDLGVVWDREPWKEISRRKR